MAGKVRHKQALERASKPASKPLRKSTLRLVELVEGMGGRLVRSVVDRWEKVLPHIPRPTRHFGDRDDNADSIACVGLLLAMLDASEIGGILRAVENAILDGTFTGDADDRTRYQLVRLRHSDEQVDADLLRRVIGRVRHKDPALGLAGWHVEQFVECMGLLTPSEINKTVGLMVGVAATRRADNLKEKFNRHLKERLSRNPNEAMSDGDDDGDDDDDDDDGDGYDGWLEPAQPPRKR